MASNHVTSKVSARAGTFGMYYAFIERVSVYIIPLHDVLATTNALKIPIADKARYDIMKVNKALALWYVGLPPPGVLDIQVTAVVSAIKSPHFTRVTFLSADSSKALLSDTEKEDGYVIGRSAILTKQNVTLAPDGVDDATTDTSDEDSFSRRLKTQPEECNDAL